MAIPTLEQESYSLNEIDTVLGGRQSLPVYSALFRPLVAIADHIGERTSSAPLLREPRDRLPLNARTARTAPPTG